LNFVTYKKKKKKLVKEEEEEEEERQVHAIMPGFLSNHTSLEKAITHSKR
jgi:hypothetical protein